MSTGVSIIIPTRNEAENIDPLVRRLLAVRLPDEVPREIIFVDDSSTDDTRERVRDWCGKQPVRLICRDGGGGLASAVIAGAREAIHDIVVVLDADLSHPPERIPDLVQPLLEGACDMVVGSRYAAGGGTPDWPWSRRFASKLATVPARLFSDVRDPLAGFFATARDRLTGLRDDVPGFKIGFEILAGAGEDFKVLEVPIVFHDRFEGFSKMNAAVILAYLKQLSQLSRLDAGSFSPLRLLALFGGGSTLDILLFWFARQNGVHPTGAHLAALAVSASLMALTAGSWWLAADSGRSMSGGRWACLGGALILAMGIQGGMFATLQRYVLAQELPAFSGGVLAGLSSFLLVSTVFVFSGYPSLNRPVRLRFAAVAVIGAVLIIRLLYLGLPELMEQEAYYWNYSRHPDFSYLDHPPLTAALIWVGTALFGLNEFGVRIGAYVCWLFTACFSYRLTSALFGRTAGIGAVVLTAVLPLYFGIGLIITPDAPLHAAWAALLYFTYRALIEGDSDAWLGVGISLGIGMIAKYTIVLLGPAVLCFMLFDRRSRRWFVSSEPYGALLLALLLFTPVLIWNMQHDWVSFLFQGERRVSGRTFFTTHRLAGYISLILTPAGILAACFFFFRGKRYFRRFIDGERRSDKSHRAQRAYVFLSLCLIVPLLVFFTFSLTREVKLNWASPLWLALVPFMSCTVMALPGTIESAFLRFVHWLWRISVPVILLVFVVAMHYVTLGLPGVPFPRGPFLIGWEHLARSVETAVETAEKERGKRPIVVGMDPYQISSGLAFYRAKNMRHQGREARRRVIEETVGWHLFGWNSLMYRYWADPQQFSGRDILAVASSEVRVEFPYYQHRISGMGNIVPMDAVKDGQPVRRFYTRLVYGYRPSPE